MDRGRPLKRTGGLSRKRFRRKPTVGKYRHDMEASAAWWDAVVFTRRGNRRGQRPCVRCESKLHVEGHHLIPKTFLKSFAATHDVDWNLLVWDTRIGVPLCHRCHEGVTATARRLPRRLVPKAAWAFAEEWDELAAGVPLTVKLEYEHPN